MSSTSFPRAARSSCTWRAGRATAVRRAEEGRVELELGRGSRVLDSAHATQRCSSRLRCDCRPLAAARSRAQRSIRPPRPRAACLGGRRRRCRRSRRGDGGYEADPDDCHGEPRASPRCRVGEPRRGARPCLNGFSENRLPSFGTRPRRLVAERGHQDDRRRGSAFTQILEHSEPVDDREAQVRDDEIVGLVVNGPDPHLPAVPDLLNLEPGAAERVGDETPHLLVVFREEGAALRLPFRALSSRSLQRVCHGGEAGISLRGSLPRAAPEGEMTRMCRLDSTQSGLVRGPSSTRESRGRVACCAFEGFPGGGPLRALRFAQPPAPASGDTPICPTRFSTASRSSTPPAASSSRRLPSVSFRASPSTSASAPGTARLERDLEENAAPQRGFVHDVLNHIVRAARAAARLAARAERPSHRRGPLPVRAQAAPARRALRPRGDGPGLILGLMGTFYGLTLSIGRLVHLVGGDAGAANDAAQAVTTGA